MAIERPLTSVSDRIDDATLRTIDEAAPRLRRAHRALDACAEAAGPQRYEEALEARAAGVDGAFFLLAQAPDELLRDLFEAAPGARSRFAAKVALSDELGPPKPPLRVRAARAAPCDPRAPMDVLLRVLARDEATSPGSIEGLFDDLEEAHRAGLIAMDAEGLALTDAGRDLMRATRDALAPLGDASLRRIDLYAQEVADGRMTLGGAITGLGAELGMDLPAPGAPDALDTPEGESDEASVPDAGALLDTTGFDPLLLAAAGAPEVHQSAVASLALHARLVEWGLGPEAAESVLRHDVRCLRALGASASHGPLPLVSAREAVADAGLEAFVADASSVIPDTLLEALVGPRRISPIVDFGVEPEAEIGVMDSAQDQNDGGGAEAPARRGWIGRLLAAIFGRRS